MEKSSFFNSVGGDRRYDAADWAEYFASFISNGVFGSPANCLQVVPGGGMNISILPGTAWINGYFYVNDSALALPLDMADGALKRIDRVVIQWSLADRWIATKIKKGITAQNPVAPVLQRDASIYELCIAELLINAGAASIAESHIADKRADHALCGVVSSIVAEAHDHDLNALSGTLALAKGGTGQTTAAGVRSALGLGSTTGALPIANGGTGATTANAARTNLGATLEGIGAAPESHASSGATYGTATDTLYGHAKASATLPKAHGTAAVGAEQSSFARGDHVHPAQTTISGNAATATRLQTERTISLSGGATGSASFDGSANAAISVTALDMGKAAAGTLPIARGGTGATDATGARSALGVTLANLGAAASSHTHTAAQITDTVPVAKGGTGATTAAAARNALGLGNTTGALPVANGGTGASDVANARNALGLGATSGALPIANGGTGATSAASARSALGLGNTSGALPVANGGTGSTSAKAALTALGIFYATSLPSSGTDGQICLVPV